MVYLSCIQDKMHFFFCVELSCVQVSKGGDMTELALTEWVNTAEGAQLTGFSIDYVRRLARGGRIEARKVGRDWLIDCNSLLAFKRQMNTLGNGKHNPQAPWRDEGAQEQKV